MKKEKYYQLDEVGIVGVQKKTTASSRAYHQKKTGEAIRNLRKAAESTQKKTAVNAR